MDKILAPIKLRIIQFIEEQGIVRETFFEKIGIAASNFRGIGRYSEIGGDKIVKILTDFKELNPGWLVMGEGQMLREPKKYDIVPIIDKVGESHIEYGASTTIDDLRSALKDKERIIQMLEEENKRLKKSASHTSSHTKSITKL